MYQYVTDPLQIRDLPIKQKQIVLLPVQPTPPAASQQRWRQFLTDEWTVVT